MDMIEFVQTIGAIVAFLLPLGMYCLLLASINRHTRPVIVGGAWDSVGLLFAGCGFLAVTAPILLTAFYRRTAEAPENERAISLWTAHWLVWLCYFVFIISSSALMVMWRSSKTMIYNVDVELFPKALEQTIALTGMTARGNSRQLVLGPPLGDTSTAFTAAAAPVVASPPAEQRIAELEAETFPSMCHVTLHWRKADPGLREEFERELAKNLESAAPMENPVAGWFLTISGLFLGAAAALLLAVVIVLFR
jgi:hypothetical protein